MYFVVVDVETANQRPSSICQIGIACFRNGALVETWGELVNPQESFLPFNTQLHGIGPRDVSHSPTWPDLQPRLRAMIEKRIVASHTFFDRNALRGADERYGLEPIPVAGWIDTCNISRAAWPHLPSYRLTSLARSLGISYRAHNATEDARCAGELLLLASQSSSIDIETLFCSQPLAAASRISPLLRKRRGAT